MEYFLFLQKLRLARLEKRLSLRALGKEIGYSGQQIWQFEKGRTAIKVEDFLSICKVLNLSPCDFFENIPNNDSHSKILQLLPRLSEPQCKLLIDLISFFPRSNQ